MYEYKLRDIRDDNISDGLVLGFRLYMSSENPWDEEVGRKRFKNELEEFGIAVRNIRFSGEKTAVVHLLDQFVSSSLLRVLMNEGIEFSIN